MDFVTSDRVRLAYGDEGGGLPVLCLAGLTRNGTDFDYVAPHLEAVRLIRLDARGRGQSERADPGSYTVAREAQDALELLDRLGLSRAAVLGTSRGGLVAMQIAATARHRLAGVALVDVGPVLEPEGLGTIMGYLGLPPAARDLDEAATLRAGLLTGFRNVPRSRWEDEARRQFIARPDGLGLPYDPRLREALLAAPPATRDPWELFDALGALPLALIRGASSDLLSVATAEAMARRRPDMIRAEVPDRGHVPFLDEPEALSALRAWLDLMREDAWTSA